MNLLLSSTKRHSFLVSPKIKCSYAVAYLSGNTPSCQSDSDHFHSILVNRGLLENKQLS